MARVTVEDCVLKVPNRFDLVMLAAQRARNVSAGAALTVDRDNDKNPVVALREIGDGTIEIPDLQESLIRNLQRHAESDEPEEQQMELPTVDNGEDADLGEAPSAELASAGIQVIDPDEGDDPTDAATDEAAPAAEEDL